VLAWLQGGDGQVLERVLKNMVGNFVGCDIRRSEDDLRAGSPRPRSAASSGREYPQDTLDHLSQLDGMESTDRTILDIMLGKKTQV